MLFVGGGGEGGVVVDGFNRTGPTKEDASPVIYITCTYIYMYYIYIYMYHIYIYIYIYIYI